MLMLATTVAFVSDGQLLYATTINCGAVMKELNSGKPEKEVATDLNITLYQVRRCKRHAKAAAKAATKSSHYSRRGKEPPVVHPPMGGPSPAVAASAAAGSR